MFGKVKRWLGIEGVKVELILPEEIKSGDGLIEGKLRFQSMHTQKVKSIKLKAESCGTQAFSFLL